LQKRRAAAATWTIAAVSVDHYENFPVASLLCPRALRPAVIAIYNYARTADDLADEGQASPQQRLADLHAYRADLLAVAEGRAPTARWLGVFTALKGATIEHKLPVQCLDDLLRAFEQDVVKQRYDDRTELLEYCRRSANPVGRLLLHLYGVRGAHALRQSDAICSALQLANFWQDLGTDARRGRLYAPASDCARHAVSAQQLLNGQDGANVRALVADLVQWTREMMLRGAPLVHAVPGRAGWELRLVVQGGLRILEKIEGMGCATLLARPTLNALDAPRLLWRALWMRARPDVVAAESA
jgi:squalene synthase HpnC